MRRHLILLLGTGALLLADSAPADWLVMRDGTRIETSGPWEVKGRQVVFTRFVPAALRLADVDLEASEAATAEPAASPLAAPEKAKRPAGPSSSNRPRLREAAARSGLFCPVSSP